jgi:EAL domain-containing protein (putative c-di-GMP-specific phosphodiesterase class I)
MDAEAANHRDPTGATPGLHVHLAPEAAQSLEIDRSFVAEIPVAMRAEAIVKAIIALARGMQLKAVAEGIETKAQERFLTEHGCDELQGVRFGVPVPAEEVKRLIGGRALERRKER